MNGAAAGWLDRTSGISRTAVRGMVGVVVRIVFVRVVILSWKHSAGHRGDAADFCVRVRPEIGRRRTRRE